MSPLLDSAPPILTAREAAEFERRYFGADPAAEWVAMEAAGRGVAAGILRDYRELTTEAPETVLVLAGKGHNGGDALIAAAALLARVPAAAVDVVFVFGERELRPLAARAWRELVHAHGPRVRMVPASAAAQGQGAPGYDISIDGVFGYQFRPPVLSPAAGVLQQANRLPVRLRAAVDLPSGLDEAEGFRADFTYATGIVKAEAVAAENSGRLRYLDLGFFRSAPLTGHGERVLTEQVLDPLRTLRPARGDKRSYGHVFIIGGSRSYPGAVLMNTLAALHSGVGMVTVFVPETLAPAYAARAPEAMWVGCPETPHGGLALEGRHLVLERWSRATALAIGSGMDRQPETLALAKELVKTAQVPVLLDGDALQPEIIATAAPGRLLLTPHAGEFARISAGADLRHCCAKVAGTIILKGPITQVCSAVTNGGKKTRTQPASLPVYSSFFGGPLLSRGGSGDILAGLAAGRLAADTARQVAPVVAAATAAVWHGLAADALARRVGQVSASVTELVPLLSEALRQRR